MVFLVGHVGDWLAGMTGQDAPAALVARAGPITGVPAEGRP